MDAPAADVEDLRGGRQVLHYGHDESIASRLRHVRWRCSRRGCQNKGPAPKEGSGAAPQVGTTETSGAHPGAAQDPHAGMDPHAQVIRPGPRAAATSGRPDASGMIDVGAVAFKVPAKWSAQAPKSSMRRAQLSAPGSAGAAELIVYFFGPQGAGTHRRTSTAGWAVQQSGRLPSDGAKHHQGRGQRPAVTRVEAAGQYSNTMAQPGQAAPAVSNQRLIAAIVESKGGPYYFKFVGPEATVTEQRQAIDALLASIVASE